MSEKTKCTSVLSASSTEILTKLGTGHHQQNNHLDMWKSPHLQQDDCPRPRFHLGGDNRYTNIQLLPEITRDSPLQRKPSPACHKQSRSHPGLHQDPPTLGPFQDQHYKQSALFRATNILKRNELSPLSPSPPTSTRLNCCGP